MWRARWICQGIVALMILALGSFARGPKNESEQTSGRQAWRDSFAADRANLSDTGRNAYMILEPGYRLILEHGKDTLIVTVLNETKLVDGVVTRLVEERETEGGQLAEVSRNYFAFDSTTGDIYYFGEDVDTYRNGKVTGHEGAWQAGMNGARFGLMMPGKPKAGDSYYQEIAPKIAMDRAQVVSLTETAKVPAGLFKNVLRTRESSAIESGSEDKWYAPDVGLIRDADFTLMRFEKVKL
jgi:hypothetical protein